MVEMTNTAAAVARAGDRLRPRAHTHSRTTAARASRRSTVIAGRRATKLVPERGGRCLQSVMVYGVAADFVVAFNFTFVLFVVLGGLLVWRWPRVAWVH